MTAPIEWMEVTNMMCVIIIIEEPSSSHLMIRDKMAPVITVSSPADDRDELSETRNRGLTSGQKSCVVNPSPQIGSVNIKDTEGAIDSPPSCYNSFTTLPIWTSDPHLLLQHSI